MIKKKIINIIIGIFLVVALLFLIIYSNRKREFNKYEYSKTVIVNNHSSYEKADTISLIILNKLFLLDSIKLTIFNMRTDLSNDDFVINAYIENYMDDNDTINKNHLYHIFIRKNISSSSIESILLHELTHLQQMDKGELIQLNQFIYPHKIVYKGDTINMLNVGYEYREYEKDAENNVKEKYNKLDKLLYKN